MIFLLERYKKLLVLFIVLVLVSLSGFVVYRFLGVNKDSNFGLVERALNLADVVVALRIGDNSIDDFVTNNSDFVTDGLVGSLRAYYDSLLALDNARFDLTGYYEEFYAVEPDYSGVDSSPVADDIEEPVVPDVLDSSEEDELPPANDPRIFTENGRDYIMVNDFTFVDGVDIVAYNGLFLVISPEDVPVTYKSMVEDPRNFYVYKSYRSALDIENPYIDVLYQSVLSGNILVVRVKVDNGKLSGFEVI